MWPNSHLTMFFGMIIIHIMIMPWIMIARFDDFMLSLNQFYMGVSMASIMVLLEGLMHPMPYSAWIGVFTLLVLSIMAVRHQWFINDKQFLRDMIPHHSMALLTSNIAKDKTDNKDIKELAKNIEENQTKEINLMKEYLNK